MHYSAIAHTGFCDYQMQMGHFDYRHVCYLNAFFRQFLFFSFFFSEDSISIYHNVYVKLFICYNVPYQTSLMIQMIDLLLSVKFKLSRLVMILPK